MAVSSIEAMFGLAGLRALVTGAATGLAEPIALRLAEAGATVIAADPDLAGAERVAGAIGAAGGSAHAIALDVTDEASVTASFAEIRTRFGGLDILVNAATMIGGCRITEMSAAQWDAMHDVNLRGAFLCSREAIRLMIEAGRGGRIISLSTIGSLHPVLRGNVAYGPSKAGLNALTRNIAFDHASDGILANAILAGAIPVNAPRMAGTVSGDGPGKDPGRLPFGYGRGEDIGTLAVYLAGPSARYLTGQCIAVDGAFLVS